jgi:hypothetical protein
VLAAWLASPARFREDANAEEDLVLGSYRDRVIVELAQNAADAAVRGGVAGRLRLTLESGVLRAANVGAPVDSAGVEAASTLRASAKRHDQLVGRFGVGFAAVLAVSDAPVLASTGGAVRWSRAETQRIVGARPELADELAARGDSVPVLRLPFASDALPPEGFDTEVALPLRDAAAVELVRRLLADVDAALLLTLPGLESVEVVVDGVVRTLQARRDGQDAIVDGVRWRLAEATGRVPAELLADRPVEERGRESWSVTWAVPVTENGAVAPMPATVPSVVHAPTPTDEPVSLPALLIATLPLDPSRRHVAPGPMREFVLDAAASSYAELVVSLSGDASVLGLVPTGLPSGELDGSLRHKVLGRLRETAFLPSWLRPADAVILDEPELVDVLTSVLPGVLPSAWRGPALAVLGVRRLSTSELVDELASLVREPEWWHDLYAALDRAHVAADVLSGLPVPLTDGGLARSPRGLLCPGGPDVGALGFRRIHPDAAHPLLRRLGAVEPEPTALLADERVRAAAAASFDEWADGGDVSPVADAILGLVAAAEVAVGEHPWLADLALPAGDGEWYPAGELLLPDGPLAAVVADDAPFGHASRDLVDEWGTQVLQAVGCLWTFAMARGTDVVMPEHDLDGEAEYLEAAAEAFGFDDEPVVVPELVAVRDLEWVRDDAWPVALRLLSRPALRALVVDPVRVICGTRSLAFHSYTAWWLRRNRVVSGVLPDADPLLVGLFEPVPQEFADLDPTLLRAAGAVRDLADADVDDVIARLVDPSRQVTREQLRGIYESFDWPRPPEVLRAVRDDEVIIASADQVVVVDAPDLLPLLGDRAVVPVPLADADRAADMLDVALASDLGDFRVVSEGQPCDDHMLHDRLEVLDVDGRPTPVPWRYADGVLHIDASAVAFGLGRGRAWRAGCWERRHEFTERLREPELDQVFSAESDLDVASSLERRRIT